MAPLLLPRHVSHPTGLSPPPAGSERQKSAATSGQQLREASAINKSLSTLGLVIMSLIEQQRGGPRHVPFRDSKLTFLLQVLRCLGRLGCSEAGTSGGRCLALHAT